MSGSRILIVEDEVAICDMISFQLSRAGYEVDEAHDCKSARELLADRRADLAIIDWMLPDMSGLELVRSLRRDSQYEDLAIIMLTARAEEQDKIRGLDSGADDYITKPFSSRELMSRIHAVLRRAAPSASEMHIGGPLKIDAVGHRVFANDAEVSLGPKEYRLLKFLLTHPERVYSRAQLLDRVWGTNVYVEERTVDVHIRRLRKALELHAVDGLIQTVRGAGYRFSVRQS
ncbi:MAG: phosphate regulon transcriptional regulator PhoB [Pseudomonadota bacterium]